jgi:bifunctional pyridoxal-dependent enzyme with beta-cystathionase and maltose regulon repressor activities
MLCVSVCSGFVTEVNAFGYEGTYAAYKFGDPWLQGMLKVDSHTARGSTGGP